MVVWFRLGGTVTSRHRDPWSPPCPTDAVLVAGHVVNASDFAGDTTARDAGIPAAQATRRRSARNINDGKKATPRRPPGERRSETKPKAHGVAWGLRKTGGVVMRGRAALGSCEG